MTAAMHPHYFLAWVRTTSADCLVRKITTAIHPNESQDGDRPRLYDYVDGLVCCLVHCFPAKCYSQRFEPFMFLRLMGNCISKSLGNYNAKASGSKTLPWCCWCRGADSFGECNGISLGSSWPRMRSFIWISGGKGLSNSICFWHPGKSLSFMV